MFNTAVCVNIEHNKICHQIFVIHGHGMIITIVKELVFRCPVFRCPVINCSNIHFYDFKLMFFHLKASTMYFNLLLTLLRGHVKKHSSLYGNTAIHMFIFFV